MWRLLFHNQIPFIWRSRGLAMVLRKVQWTLQACRIAQTCTLTNCDHQMWPYLCFHLSRHLATCNSMLRPGPIGNLGTQLPIYYKQHLETYNFKYTITNTFIEIYILFKHSILGSSCTSWLRPWLEYGMCVLFCWFFLMFFNFYQLHLHNKTHVAVTNVSLKIGL